MNKNLLLAIITLNSLFLFGQENVNYQKYVKLVESAKAEFKNEKYTDASKLYTEAFKLNIIRGTHYDRLNASESYAQIGYIDSAFVQLFLLANKFKWQGKDMFENDKYLSLLHKDKRWEDLMTIFEKNKKEVEGNYNNELIEILEKVYQDDQKYRKEVTSIEDKYGINSKEVNDYWKFISEKDSLNTIIVTQIIDEYGWLGPDVIKSSGSQTLFLVIQHSDFETQKKYLPILKEAVYNHKASPSNYALLIDRVKMRSGEKQIFGSQINLDKETEKYFLYPVIDPENIDKRRRQMGLQPISDYLKIWDIDWNVEEYIKILPELEEKVKK